MFDDRLDFQHLDTHQMLLDEFSSHAVWLFDELLPLHLACADLDVAALLLILAIFPVYLFVPQADELRFVVGHGSSEQIRVLFDIAGEPSRMLQEKHAVKINQFHAVLDGNRSLS